MPTKIGRNQICFCGSGKKFKKCCIYKHRSTMKAMSTTEPRAIDYGEDAVRWVICDKTGTQFFVDKQGRILVFTDKQAALAAATLDVFENPETDEINVAGVGQTKWQKIQDALPHVEVPNLETATALIRERIDDQMAQLTAEPAVTTHEFPEQPATPEAPEA
jgi:hypothetical protein